MVMQDVCLEKDIGTQYKLVKTLLYRQERIACAKSLNKISGLQEPVTYREHLMKPNTCLSIN